MKLLNPFLSNDWNIKTFFIVIFSFYFIFLGSIGLNVLDISLPLYLQIIDFLFLVFVPGLLLLRILQMHHLGAVKTTVYSTGLSLTILMLTGFFINTIYPLCGISHPLLPLPIMLTLSGVILLLSILTYIKDRTYSSPDYLNFQEVLSPMFLFLGLLPFISILGTHLVNVNKNNFLLIILLALIGLIFIIMTINNKYEPFYPFAIFAISISLLYQSSLISTYIVEWADASIEYWTAFTVISGSIWNPMIPSTVNGMLSIVILPTIYSTVLNVDLLWVFKVIYPILFSMV
jgi:uncharacterized membrane protein